MFLKIGQRPDHGFDEPLGLLRDCHRRIEHFLSVLMSISSQHAGEHLDTRSREQLEGALRYFATAAPRHTADEEQSLFPRLAAAHDPNSRKAIELVQRLECDHTDASVLHATVDRLGRQWLQAGALPAGDAMSLREAVERLDSLYKSHIAVEDQQLFPAAAGLLSADDLRDIGQEMARRRR
jgi:hemerythrin-like domain-containing protein